MQPFDDINIPATEDPPPPIYPAKRGKQSKKSSAGIDTSSPANPLTLDMLEPPTGTDGLSSASPATAPALNLEQLTKPLSMNVPAANTDTLSADNYLVPEQDLESQDGRFRLLYQTDGNLVVYRNRDGAALWASGTDNPGAGAGRCYMQLDGNLVVYDRQEKALWASNTDRPETVNYKLIMQNDGNLVIYTEEGHPCWASGTWGQC